MSEVENKDRYKFETVGRDWLNPVDHGDTGSIKFYVYADNGYAVNSTLEISDCTKKVFLEFGYMDEEEYQQRLEKIDKIMIHLSELKDGLMTSWPNFCEMKKKEEEKRSERNKEPDKNNLFLLNA